MPSLMSLPSWLKGKKKKESTTPVLPPKEPGVSVSAPGAMYGLQEQKRKKDAMMRKIMEGKD